MRSESPGQHEKKKTGCASMIEGRKKRSSAGRAMVESREAQEAFWAMVCAVKVQALFVSSDAFARKSFDKRASGPTLNNPQ